MTAEEPRITHLRSVCQGPGTTLSVCILFIMFTTTLQGRFEQSQFTHKDQQSVLIQGHIASVKMPTPKSDVPTLPLRLPSVPALWAFSVPSGDSSHRPGVSRVYMWLHRPLLGRVTTVTRSCSPFTPQIILFVKARASKFASLPRGHLWKLCLVFLNWSVSMLISTSYLKNRMYLNFLLWASTAFIFMSFFILLCNRMKV